MILVIILYTGYSMIGYTILKPGQTSIKKKEKKNENVSLIHTI